MSTRSGWRRFLMRPKRQVDTPKIAIISESGQSNFNILQSWLATGKASVKAGGFGAIAASIERAIDQKTGRSFRHTLNQKIVQTQLFSRRCASRRCFIGMDAQAS